MNNLKVKLHPLIFNINLPTVLKTTILPGELVERLFVATQVGEIYYLANGTVVTFLDIRSQVLKLGSNGGYDERGLLGLAFHPHFYHNGLFYIHYSLANTQGPGALSYPYQPDPCEPSSLHLKWTNREERYDHIDTVEEWFYAPNQKPQKRRILLNVRRPFANHNGVNSLNFSPETGKLVLTTGDGGAGYDPFNLAQNDLEIAGKIIEIDIDKNVNLLNPPIVSRFDELPLQVQETLTVIAKGVRNIPGISYQRFNHQYTKYVGMVGQDIVESIFSFTNYRPIPVTELVYGSKDQNYKPKGFINFGWRAWEGELPTAFIQDCPNGESKKTVAFFREVLNTSILRLPPLISYFHQDKGEEPFLGTAITGVQPYLGKEIPSLSGRIIFIDLSKKGTSPTRGILAHTNPQYDCSLNEYYEIEIDYEFGQKPAFFTSLGTNLYQNKLYLGVYASMNVTDLNKGTIFEIIP